MAFCTKCGAQMQENVKFCTSCGAAADAAPATQNTVSAPAAAAAAPAVATATPTASPAKKGMSTGLKIVLIVVAIVVGLAIVAAVGISYFVTKTVKVDGDTVTINTPGGSLTANTDSKDALKELGVEGYPGATASENAGVFSAGGSTWGGAEFTTSDSVEQVLNFYKSKYPNAMVQTYGGETANLMVTVNKESLINITIQREEGVTKINLAKISGKPAEEASDVEASSGE